MSTSKLQKHQICHQIESRIIYSPVNDNLRSKESECDDSETKKSQGGGWGG